MQLGAESTFVIYLREYEPIFETASAAEPGGPGVLFAEKHEGRKFRDTVPLSWFKKISAQILIR
jgi:hypothetical protein